MTPSEVAKVAESLTEARRDAILRPLADGFQIDRFQERALKGAPRNLRRNCGCCLAPFGLLVRDYLRRSQ